MKEPLHIADKFAAVVMLWIMTLITIAVIFKVVLPFFSASGPVQ